MTPEDGQDAPDGGSNSPDGPLSGTADGPEPPVLGQDISAEEWYQKGSVHWDERKVEWAANCFERAVEKDEEMEKGWLALGIAKKENGDFLDALTAFNRVIDLNPRSEKAYYNKHQLLLGYDIKKDALRVLDDGIDANPSSFFLLQVKGELLKEWGYWGGALEAFEKALEFNPQHKVLLYSRDLCMEEIEKRSKKGFFSRRKERRDPEKEGEPEPEEAEVVDPEEGEDDQVEATEVSNR